tara:strand:- start:98 stop:511 length:414 start_codon:yes stop_codon:yes gene_type:complete
MSELLISIGKYKFEADFEDNKAPVTCSKFRKLMPYSTKVIHVRWSGEGVWVPLGENHFDLPFENNTSYPSAGQIILYPGGISEAEILISYGNVSFSSRVGQLAGNHFISINEGVEQLNAMGKDILWNGAQDVKIALH